MIFLLGPTVHPTDCICKWVGCVPVCVRLCVHVCQAAVRAVIVNQGTYL